MSDFPELPAVDISEEIPARRALRAWLARQPDLYALRGTLHRWEADADGGAGSLVRMDADTLTDYVADRLNTMRGDRSVLLPSRLAKALLRSAGAGLREVEGVERWPVVRPDGTIHAVSGYDPATRLMVALVDDVKPVSDRPEADEVERARALVLRLFAGFPFKTEADRAATLSMYLGPLLRRFLPEDARAPLFAYTASAPGSGKTYCQTGAAILYGAVDIPLSQSQREQQKHLISALERNEGAGCVNFDNAESGSRIEGGQWAAWLTAPTVSGRVIGTGRTPSIPNRFVWSVSANNLKIGGDLARRTQMIRLEPDADRPEEVAHAFDFLEEIRSTRGDVLWALLTLVRSWTSIAPAQRPTRTIRLGQFSAFMTTAASILDHAGIEGMGESREAVMTEADEASADFGRFYAALHDTFGEDEFRASDVTRTFQDLIPRGSTYGEQDRKIGHRALGRLILRPATGRVMTDPDTGQRYTIAERYDRHAKAFVYAVRKVAQRAAGALRAVAQTARRVAARVVRVEQPARRTWPELKDKARARREVADWIAGAGVRVEESAYAAALTALGTMAPARA